MEAKTLQRLQPHADTVDGIRVAATRIDEQKKLTEARIIELRTRRGRLLVSGTAKDVITCETEIREAEVEIEQLQIMREAMRPRFVELAVNEAVEEFERHQAEAAKDIEAARKFWEDEYPGLAGKIRAGLLLIQNANNARDHVQFIANDKNHIEQVRDSGRIIVRLPHIPNCNIPGSGPHGYAPIGQSVQLPGCPAHPAPFWWPSVLLGRPHPDHR